ncbi:sensor domain-containing phosphodiesterase [Magnetospirillum moscoviense]|uniref:Signal transduction protein n=1 Tax=Magnetospirillum moscoviense TaxID=1437059 RepID=A0A178N015_9PROT|nr:EAL domain-containing protein [Magnetospirillum moscoviense]MBF0324386.1 EAL domain-containing protein [Alphaproteobacteria bacterium]OAN66990.1 signal transduction protein [Magnetospirillum moscoviense]
MGDEAGMVEKLKAQRDRFIAFAFAGADLLLEVTEQNQVAYSAGAGEALYGLTDNDLMGKPLGDLVHPKDRKRFDESMQRLKNTGRLDHTPLMLVGSAGTVTRMRMAGIRLPQFPKTYHVVLSRVPPIAVAEADRVVGDVDHKAQFIEMVRTRLNEANRIGTDYTLTLFDLSATNFNAIEPAIAQTFLATVQHTLDECSVRGASAGALSTSSFGLVHDDKTSAAEVHKRVSAVADKFAGKTNGAASVKMRTASLEMEDSALSDEDISKALTYIVNGFVKDSARFALKSLAEGARVAVEDTLIRVRNFRKMIKGDDKLIFLFQPIVNVRTGAVLQYEAFSRIQHNGAFFTPNQIIPFATDVGVIGEFDLIAVTKALKILKEPGEVSSLANIAVNISGQSLGNPGFYHSLLKLMDQYKSVLGRLVLEVTDATDIYNLDEAKRLLMRIRKMGTRISLDDFGSGGSAFDLLRILPVDFAKFDHDYVRDAHDPKGRSVLKAMTSLCHDLGIVTIGECVEDAAMLRNLADIGVDYAQGYYFGQPAADVAKRIKYFTDHVKQAGTAQPGLAMGG